ncbi:ATP-binding cassette domain-containing protein [Microbacterium oxydans]|jgi:ABC-type transport system involved in cytochrome bd biosynthesis fused ATPase/permease subunit|uniref:ATP-binding cassette domain-containing protein n=1 Tax=Microbacterium oxydans TaxID=82380 RepID=UPI0014777D0E|nr:ATP-binding cassette domain-containing protein [Microbacterium oxydans]
MMIVPELWREARRHPWLLAWSTLLLLLVYATHLLQALALAWSLAALVRGEGQGAVVGIGVILVIGVTRMLLTIVQGDAAARLGGRVREDLRGAAVSAVLVPERLHDAGLRDGSTQLALGDGIDGTDAYVSKYIPAVVQLVVGSLIAVCLVAVLSPLIALCVAAGILLAVLGPLLWKRMLARRGFEHWDSYEALSGDLLESLRGMSTLRALGDVPATRARLHTRSEALRLATERVMRTSLAETAITDLAVQAGVVVAAGLAVVAVLTGEPPAVEVYALLLLSSEAFRPVRELSRHWHAGFLGLTAVPGLATLGAFRRSPAPVPVQADADAHARPAGQVLRISGLSYRYPGADRDVLRGVDLLAERGEVHAIAGPSGAGKSTLFDLVLGFLPAAAGTVEFDGRPLQPSDVAVVSQRPVLFAGTIRENIDLFGADREDVERACAAAGVLDEIRAIPGGFEAMVAEAGTSLSGGQRQRLALARALLAGRPVLLVDEPTSALDDRSALTVAETLERVAEERIVLMISHRPEALARVADVRVLRDGVLVEEAP